MTETLTMVAQEQALDPSKQGTIGLKCRPRKTPQKRAERENTEDLERKTIPVIIGSLGVETTRLEKLLQQIPRTTSEISIKKSVTLALRTANVVRETLNLPGLL
ncbi:unnamed protein product [Dracunculus medinensis]|uniref:Uncharacterized protein n=1 Tax=Dracunculus medinensis TaxID=318479 RepID=A0A0N4U0D1_DRAME|nr:unnamed protein product [Dracunculus medinensis]